MVERFLRGCRQEVLGTWNWVVVVVVVRGWILDIE